MRRHSPARFRHGTLLGLVAACLVGWAATVQAAQWADIATISSTLGNNIGRLCVGGGATGLGCPGYAPQLGASGDVTVTGTLGATRFYGDGSGLTNLNLSGAQVDRIISGTAGIFVSNTGVISFYGASGLSGYFDATGLLVAPSVSLTGANGLSAIKGYFSGNVGVGTSNPSTPLEVVGTVSATAFVGDGSGLTNISVGAISMSLDDLSDASASTALGSMYIGSGVGNNAAVTGSLGLGVDALVSNLTGSRNVAMGHQALRSNTSGIDNTAVGSIVMISNTTGSNNTALGVGALGQNVSGNGNVAVGRGSLTRNTTAYYNIAIGYSTGAWMSTGQRNIFMGYNAGFYNTTGNNNLVLGTNAGQGANGTTTYGDSVLLGYRAGAGLTTGSSNTFVGNSAGSNHVSGQYNIALGAGSQLLNTTGDYQMNIGNAIYGDLSGADTNRAKIGVNVINPATNLEVSGTVSATAFVGDGSGLTNINASAVAGLSTDRITSGTAGIFVSNTGIINLRTGGTTTGYFDASGLLVAPGISLTTGHGISSTSGYFSAPLVVGQTSSGLWFASSGISTTSIYNRLLVYADAANNYSPTDNADMTIFSLNRNAGVNVAGLATSMYFWPVQSYLGKIYSSYSQTQVGSINYDTNGVAGNNAGTYNFRIQVSSTQVMQLLSTSTILSGTLRTTSWTLINANSHTRVPRAPLEVSGTVSATAFVGDGSGLTNLNLGGIQADRITSGTAGIFVSNTGIINLRTGGTTTGYFDTTGLLVTPGISTTASGISTTNLTVRGTIDVLSGTSNVLVGQFAGASGAGANNTAVGMYASRNNSGSYVLSFGHAAARYNTGTQVLALGYVAAERNTNWYITAVGSSAAQDNTGRTITAVGYSTAASNTGNRLTAVGANAAQNNTGSYTTALGLFAAQNNTHDNVTALGYNAQSDKANQVILGDGNVVEVTTTGVILARGVSTTGVISATAFVGDGSGLTNLNLGGIQADRITSGTAGIFVSNTGIINLRTGGTTTGYFDTSGLLVVPGISTTGMISTTNLYMQPTYSHPYYGPSSKFAAISIGSDINNSFVIGASGGTTYLGARNNVMEFSTVRENGGAPDDIIFRHANLSSIVTSLILKGSSGWLGIGSGSAMDPSASLHVSGTTRITSWTMLNANAAPTAPLEVSGTVSATAFVGNGSGLTNLPAANLSETISINDLSDASSTYASGNLFMGSYAAGEVTGGANNTAMGVLALASTTTGGYNTAVGYKAMRSFNGAVLGRNVAIGYRAMHNLTSGVQNVAIGYDALYHNTVGNNNTAIGGAALANNVGSHNTVVGRNALYNNTYGNENVAMGMEIGAATASSSQYISTSVLLGTRVGYNLGYAQNNVLIGYRSGYTMTNGNYNIVIGTDTTMPYNAAGSYQLNLGNALYGDLSGAAAANARLGINVASPTLALEVSGTVSATAFVGNGSGLTNLNLSSIQTDRITSGTAGVFVSDTGIINLRTGGTTTGYFDTSGLLVAPGISLTTANGISSTRGYFSNNLTVENSNITISTSLVNGLNLIRSSGNSVLIKVSNTEGAFYMGMDQNENFGVGPSPNMALISGLPYLTMAKNYNIGIGVLNPARNLHVSGSAVVTSWTGINFNGSNVTPTTPLEVSGTVSATLVQVGSATPPSTDCDDATDYGKLGLDPTTFQPRMCLPR